MFQPSDSTSGNESSSHPQLVPKTETSVAAKFKCEICDKSFRHATSLTTHRHRHLSNNPFKCETCGKSFTESLHLRRHSFTHFEETETFSCEICKQVFPEEVLLKEHAVIHFAEASRSDSENSLFSDHLPNDSPLLQHTKEGSDSNENMQEIYRCAVCELSFYNMDYFNLHACFQENAIGCVDSNLFATTPSEPTSLFMSFDHVDGRGKGDVNSNDISSMDIATNLSYSYDHALSIEDILDFCDEEDVVEAFRIIQDDISLSSSQSIPNNLPNEAFHPSALTAANTEKPRADCKGEKQLLMCGYCDSKFYEMAKLEAHMYNHAGGEV